MSDRRGSEWEVLEGLKDGQRFDRKPELFNGFLHKKRKWPLKGWHKRYFVVDAGILVYAKGPADISRGRFHGSVDVGLSVISAKERRRRIDIDAEEFIYHLRAKTPDSFRAWISMLKAHRLYRQHLLTFGRRDPPSLSPLAPQPRRRPSEAPPAPDSGLEAVARELGQARLSLRRLAELAAALDSLAGSQDGDAPSADGSSPNVKKDRKKFGLRKKKSGSSKGGSVDLSVSGLRIEIDASSAVSFQSLSLGAPSSPSPSASAHSPPPLADPSPAVPRPQSLPGPESDQRLREDFAVLAKDVAATLKDVCDALAAERDRLRDLPDPDAALRSDLRSALRRNSELRDRLARIHDASDVAETSEDDASGRSPSRASASEFFDARDRLSSDGSADVEGASATASRDGVIELEGDTSSEAGSLSSEEGSVSSDNSEPPVDSNPSASDASGPTGRRTRLPAGRPDTEGPSLWNLLCKNIGKDLSQVSMPVTINEPLNMLQRLCEELEYCELLERAAAAADPVERMTLVAAFAVSAYGSTRHRAASKPFNPLLGETYECVREDRGFRFVAEQVSHHPPVSACHAESRHFQFWQEARIKTKFWGKSMEFQPASTVNLILTSTGDRYTWNKVTTCVHNLFGGQRWVDQYGELKIVNEDVLCKLTFVKANYWSAKRHEVHGGVTSPDGRTLRKLYGRWSEALYCGQPPSGRCLWRPGNMPEDFESYYGFTGFATELNELDPELAKRLPPTDTRFRPDQRALEEGDVEKAETLKLRLEQAQRERRKRLEESGGRYAPKWFGKGTDEKGEECWRYTGKYWETRKSPGFADMSFEPLW